MNSSVPNDAAREGPTAAALPAVALIPLGCPKNDVDGEVLLARLEAAGYPLAGDVDEAGIVIVNTCAFIAEAQRESIETVLELVPWRTAEPGRRLIVAGCLAQRHGAALLREMPEIDGLLGPGRREDVVTVIAAACAGERPVALDGFGGEDPHAPRYRLGAPHTAYVKIAEGCDHRCRYCLIPRLRGPQRSRPAEAIVAEVEGLAAEGVREVVLIAQDTTAYGRDGPGGSGLTGLLRRLLRAPGPEWMRVLYTHPRHWDAGLIELFGEGGRLLPYVDLPIQHCADRVLGAMGRGYNGGALRALIERMRAQIPRLVLRTTVITGHPGEGPAEHRELLEFLREFAFDRLGAFAYSAEAGTPSAAMRRRVSRERAQARRQEVLAQQQPIAVRLQRARRGEVTEVLVEGVHSARRFLLGRSYGEAPEIDGQVYVRLADHLARELAEPGTFLRVRMEHGGLYDLFARPVGDARTAGEEEER